MVQWAAGDRVTASKLSTTRLSAAASALLVVTTTPTDVTDLTITITTTRANVDVQAHGVLDAEALNTTPGVVVGQLLVDGNAQTAQILWKAGANGNAANTGARVTVGQNWTFTLATAGSHTIKIQASMVGGTAAHARVNALHSTLNLVVEDHV